jgi:uncharacterized protein YcbX
VTGYSEGPEIEAWLTSIFGIDIVLVRAEDIKVNRNPLEEKYSFRVNEEMRMHPGFSDNACHFMSEKSLQWLRRLVNNDAIPVTGDQFRANIVVEGNFELEEDNMRRMTIDTKDGKIPCEIVRFSSRCIATTYDYEKGVLSACAGEVGEPLKSIRKHRHNEQGDLFGLYFQPEFSGIVSIGDTITYTHRSKEDIQFDDPDR